MVGRSVTRVLGGPLTLTHERVDDIPVIIGLAQQLGMAEVLDGALGTHGLHRGLSVGQIAVGWLAYILSQADHRKSAVQGWAESLPHTLGHLLGQPIREVEFNDDRLGAVLRRLSDDGAWARTEAGLWAASVTAYELPLEVVRLDSTTSYGYHQIQPDGLMQLGHSKDHRPDLPQLKLMAAAAQPSGYLIASDALPGQRADDQLYLPLIQRVRRITGRRGLVYAGDCKMAALSTRADLAAQGDYYLVSLPLPSAPAAQRSAWIEAALTGEQATQEIWAGERLLGSGYEVERTLRATVDEQPVEWTERVQIIHSLDLAARQRATLAQRLDAATAALMKLTPSPGRGRRQLREQAALDQRIALVLARYDVADLLTVAWTREATLLTRGLGRGRRGPDRPTHTEEQVRYVITGVQRDEPAIAARARHLGWRYQATNASVTRLSLTAAVLEYRDGWSLERDFHLLKDLPLGLSPLFVWREDQIIGLTRLLTLGLRLLTLLEIPVRRGLAQEQEVLAGLYDGQPGRTTDRPTGKRILRAFARAQLTLTRIGFGATSTSVLTPLSRLHQRLLYHLRLPPSLYTDLAATS